MARSHEKLIRFASKRGVVRPRDLTALGIDRSALRALVRAGILIRTGRGIYSLSDYEVTESHSLVEATRSQSKGVVCLVSALRFHGVGTQQPREVWLAIPHGSRVAVEGSVRLRVVVVRGEAYSAGIENHMLEGVEVPVYSIAKTIADCFKFRNKLGLDVAIEALREALRDRRCTRDEILAYAKVNRVERIVRPYVEALSL